MAIEFRLLGGVEASVDGRAVDLGHARQRCVLAALLVDANRVVPADELVDHVWADRLPQRARAALSGYLSRLRLVLAGTEVGLVRHPEGYALMVDPMAVDLHRFRHLVAQARAADDEEDAAALLEEALGLWRGEAFATLDTPWLASVRSALEGERHAAWLDRTDLALDRGRHAALLGDLTAHAAAHPLDERLAGQLMLALYRCDRQSDALRHYHQIRQRLAEELGADPSPPLQQLHKQILTADQALAWSAPPAAAPVPRQLPAPPQAFTGRARELARLDVVASKAGNAQAMVVAVVSGTAGVGKTALAAHWAHTAADRFPDGQLYVNLRGFDPGGGAVTPAEAVRGFLDALGVPPLRVPAGLDAQAALYRSVLAGRRVLVVLDNARDSGQVRPLLPGSPGCLVLVTSRDQLTGLVAGEGAQPLSLGLLTAAEAHDLLARRLGPIRVASEPEATAEVVAHCAGLPLALSVAAARAATNPRAPLATLAGELRDARGVLDAFATGDPGTDLRAVLACSYRTLRDPTARLFRLLGLHPCEDVTVPVAASLAAVPAGEARRLLRELERAHLVTEPVPGRYAFHDLLHAYAAEQAHAADGDAERHAAVHRLLDHYLHTAHAAARLLYPHREPIDLAPPPPGVAPEHPTDHEQALAWFTAKRPALVAAVEQAAGAGFDVHAWQLAWILDAFLERWGHWHDSVATQTAALDAARRLADRSAQALAHRGLACAQSRLGLHDLAQRHLERALGIHGEFGDRVGQARTHGAIGSALERQGRHAEARDHAEQTLALSREASDLTGQAKALNAVGWYSVLAGDPERAIATSRQALDLFRQLDHRYGQAATWDSLGLAHHRLGNRQQAVACYQRSLELYAEEGYRPDEAATLDRLGDTYQSSAQFDAARDAWKHAVDILDQLGDPDADQVRAKLDRLDQPADRGNRR